MVMVQKNHHSDFLTFFLAKNSCIFLKKQALYEILEAPKFAEEPPELAAEPPNFAE